MKSSEAGGTTRVLLGLGANLGDPAGQLAEAVRLLSPSVTLEAVSSVYRTEPVGFRDQPDFLNLVCMGRTTLPAAEVLGLASRVEVELGRTRGFRNEPRVIDVDLLAYGDLVVDAPALTVPHPRMHERAFVLVPLVEIAPEWRHPALGRTARELLEGLEVREGVERVERVGGPPSPSRGEG